MGSSDWDDLLTDKRWLVGKNDVVEVSSTRRAQDGLFQPTSDFLATFPILSKFLSLARVTDVKINGQAFYIYGWTDINGHSFGWQSPFSVSVTDTTRFHPQHILLLSSFGGIKERWNEPDTWLLNLNSALCAEEISVGWDGWEDYYFDLCNEMQIQPNVNPADYRIFAPEANGNCTMYHYKTGQVLMFAHDHGFSHIKPFENSPEYTLYTINDCPDFRTWVETVAKQWLQFVQNAG